jgi:hypothetical protein
MLEYENVERIEENSLMNQIRLHENEAIEAEHYL